MACDLDIRWRKGQRRFDNETPFEERSWSSPASLFGVRLAKGNRRMQAQNAA
jgi:hypothetical protein